MSVIREIDGEQYRVIAPSEAKLDTLDATVEQLEAEARKRWGDRWLIRTKQFSDGDFRAYAMATFGQTDDGRLIEHRLSVNDAGEVAVERYVIVSDIVSREPIEPIDADEVV